MEVLISQLHSLIRKQRKIKMEKVFLKLKYDDKSDKKLNTVFVSKTRPINLPIKYLKI